MTDREAIEALTDKSVVNPYLTLDALEIAIDALRERAERKTGKWIETGYVDGINVLDGKCSICGEWIDVKRKSVNGGLRYCPFCGIKMEVDE